MARKAVRETNMQPTNNEIVTISEALNPQYQVPTVNIPYAPDELEDPDYDEMMGEIDRVQSECGSASSEAFINAFRILDGKEEAFLGRFVAKEFSLDELRKEFGGGTFRIRGFCPKPPPQNGVRLFMNRVVRMEVPKKVEASQSDTVLSAIAAMQSNMEKMMLGFSEAIARAIKPPENNRMQILEEMKIMREMFTSSTPPAPEKDVMGELDKMLSLQQKLQALSGGGEGGSSYMPLMLEMVKPLIGPVTQQLQQKIVSSQNPIPQVPTALTQPVQPKEGIEKMSQADEMNQIKAFSSMLMLAAKNDMDTVTYANMVLDHVPPDAVDQLLDDPKWFDKLCNAVPEAKNHQPWFERLYSDIKEMLTEDENPGTSEEGVTGNNSNVLEQKT